MSFSRILLVTIWLPSAASLSRAEWLSWTSHAQYRSKQIEVNDRMRYQKRQSFSEPAADVLLDTVSCAKQSTVHMQWGPTIIFTLFCKSKFIIPTIQCWLLLEAMFAFWCHTTKKQFAPWKCELVLLNKAKFLFAHILLSPIKVTLQDFQSVATCGCITRMERKVTPGTIWDCCTVHPLALQCVCAG